MTIQLTVKAWSHLSQGSNAHEQCVTRCPVFQLVDLPSKRDYLENFHPGNRETQNWDPRLLGWLDCHISAKVDFCCFYLRCHVFCFYRQILCPLLNLTDFSKLLSAHTKFQFSLSTSSYPLLLIKWSFGLIHVLLIQIVSKISEKQTWTKNLTIEVVVVKSLINSRKTYCTYFIKISTSMFFDCL